ncbi:protein translocase SEC61 complex subunit gamma [Candidatus Micrarchaeota archaeon]|nr:protein translocase SEC61 complex subunit gamma [Candidatus Micrarchaeota archaeon]
MGDFLEIQELIKRCIRILYIARKPTGPEYSKVAKVTALGMFLFGLLGFVITMIFGFIG